MPHPTLDNRTPFVVDPLYSVDEEGRPIVTVVVKATFDITREGQLALAEVQRPLCAAGELWSDEAEGEPCYRLEPEVAPLKLATDVVFVGHAVAPNAHTTWMDVGVRVADTSRYARVFGERVWFNAAGRIGMTAPLAFKQIPLSYERAFGGWDRTHPDPSHHALEPRNPVGRGFFSARTHLADTRPAANIEDMDHPIRAHTDRPPPAGFGFVPANASTRAQLAGSYDAKWARDRSPLLPTDFDRRFFNAASPGLIMRGYLSGREPISTVGMVPEGNLGFYLPGLPPPRVRVATTRGPNDPQATALDTVIVDTDTRQVVLLWRAYRDLAEGPHEVLAIESLCDEARALPRAVSRAGAVADNGLY